MTYPTTAPAALSDPAAMLADVRAAIAAAPTDTAGCPVAPTLSLALSTRGVSGAVDVTAWPDGSACVTGSAVVVRRVRYAVRVTTADYGRDGWALAYDVDTREAWRTRDAWRVASGSVARVSRATASGFVGFADDAPDGARRDVLAAVSDALDAWHTSGAHALAVAYAVSVDAARTLRDADAALAKARRDYADAEAAAVAARDALARALAGA